ncbi:MAG: hypothetical protein HY828_16595 [Actinobacteria bacterium]|nr:hypothetical protein [Actinomycetota bacterium]
MRSPLRPSARLVLVPLSAGLLLFASCGGDDSSSQVASLGTLAGASTETTVSSGDTQEQWLQFAQCMRDNGVDMADPTFDADGNLQGGFGPDSGIDFRDDATRTALEACQEIMPAGGPGGGGGGPQFDRTEIQESLTEFTACLRDQGLEVDDVDFGAGPGGAGPGGPPADGSLPTPPADGGGGFQGGPPPDGSFPAGGPGGEGFDPTARILEQLGLDTTDPAVTAAVDSCSAVLDGAFAGSGA